MQKQISYFDYDWNRERREGGLRLTFDDRTRVDLSALDLDELSLLCSLLRAEKPIFYDAETRTFSTQRAVVGDSG